MRREEMKKSARGTVIDRVDFLDTVASRDPVTHRHLNGWRHGIISFEEMLMLVVSAHVEMREDTTREVMQRTIDTKVQTGFAQEVSKEKGRLQQNLRKYAEFKKMTRVELAEMEQAVFSD